MEISQKEIHLDYQIIIFGIDTRNPDTLLNLCVVLAKKIIYDSRFKNQRPNMTRFFKQSNVIICLRNKLLSTQNICRNLRISGIYLVILSCRLNSLYAGMDYEKFVLLCFVLVL